MIRTIARCLPATVVLVTALLLAGGCGGSDDDEVPATTTAVPLPAVTARATIAAGTAVPETALQPSGMAFATADVEVRDAAGLSSAVIATEPRNAVGIVMQGPVAADGQRWWQLRYDDGVVGWSAEGSLRAEPGTARCDFSKPVELRPATTYNVLGEEAFDTLVCGYLKVVPEVVEGQTFLDAYLTVVDHTEEGFLQAIDAEIRNGNTVNRKGVYYYEFNLGCLEDGRIVGGAEMDPQTMQAVLESSPARLVSLVLSFDVHYGGGCDCCSFAERAKLY